jgi:plasmid stability protein
MNNITIQNFDDDLKNRLQKRAEYYGRSLEEEAEEILRAVLTENALEPLNLASAIERRFAHFGDFELPTITREPLQEPPNLQDLHDCT